MHEMVWESGVRRISPPKFTGESVQVHAIGAPLGMKALPRWLRQL